MLPVAPSTERAWPELLAPADPYAGDEAVADAVPGQADDGFGALYRDVLDGRRPWSQVPPGPPRRHDSRPPREAPVRLDDAIVGEWAIDVIPDLGSLAPDRVLGPWSGLPLPQRVRAVAAAVMAFSPLLPPSVRPVARILRDRPRPPGELRAALKVVHSAPPMAWKVGPAGLVPLLPLGPAFVPPGPIAVGAPAVIARAVPGSDGWWLFGALPFPGLPDARVLERRLDLEYLRLLRHEPRLTWEDLLRDRAEVLYRTVCEWAWLQMPEEVLPCWSR